MSIDLTKFAETLPYASELFGIYQPMLGWKSKRIVKRINLGFSAYADPAVRSIAATMHPSIDIKQIGEDLREFDILEIGIAAPETDDVARAHANIDSYVARAITVQINRSGFDLNDDDIWNKLVSRGALEERLDDVKRDPAIRAKMIEDVSVILNRPVVNPFEGIGRVFEAGAARRAVLDRESVVAGTLNYLFENALFAKLRQVFEPAVASFDLEAVREMRRFVDPLESFDPRTDIDRVALSPVGQVHLFRQYFFEFDTFLGPPVQHIWLSPGSSLELIETSTRKTTIERTAETIFETTTKTEKSSTQQDELSDAVREENQSNTKFGASVTAGATGGATTPLYSATAHAEATVSYGSEATSKASKETAHKQMRLQSDKIASEIKQNFKTTFKTVSEVTDTSSKRYLLQNATGELVNYELRRKMRQVGVQVQDIGAQLCWQTYVDLPGKFLGLSNLVHIAQPPDYSGLHAPAVIPPPPDIEKDLTVPLAFQGGGHDNDTNVHYTEKGPWSELAHPDNGDPNDTIRVNYRGYAAPIVPNYVLKDVKFVSVLENKQVTPEFAVIAGKTFDIHLRSVNFGGDAITLQVKLVYVPADAVLAKIAADGQVALTKFEADKQAVAQATLVKEARDRVKLASNIQPRRFEDLREEERIIVYRELIKDLLNVTQLTPSAQVRHVLSELISSMFDVDKMLYFVAPDWWAPRVEVDVAPKPPVFSSADVVGGWTSGAQNYRKNYYITEDSAPARLGSSIGWLLQLDADNMRNAFLNAPWVKAVIPIRPGKEIAALNWLSSAAVEGAADLDARYQESDDAELGQIAALLEAYPWDEGPERLRYADFVAKLDAGATVVSIRDALRYLAITVGRKNAELMKVRTETVDGTVKSYLPTEKVFEHGFDPLQGGFTAGGDEPFAVFTQWVEVLPTDQVVAVEVKYDPKTGRQV